MSERDIPDGFVRMGKHRCLICGQDFESGEVLIDKRLKEIPEDATVTDLGLCPEHKALHEQGYIALIVCDEAKSPLGPNGEPDVRTAHRTGQLVHIREEAWRTNFNLPVPERGVALIGIDLFDMIVQAQQAAEQEPPTGA